MANTSIYTAFERMWQHTSDLVSNEINDVISTYRPKAGFIYPLASSVVPEGFLLCDGAAYSRTEYPELFTAIGTIYGAGDGSTTFNVPNLATRVPVGTGTGYALGATGGEEKHTLTAAEMPSHSHHYGVQIYGNTVGNATLSGNASAASLNKESSVAGGSQPHNNMQPYTVVNYIIATGKNTGVSVQDIITGAQAIPLGVEYGGTGATDAAIARQNIGAQTKHIAMTVTLSTSGWSSNKQTVAVSGVTSENTVIVVAHPSCHNTYSNNGVVCSSQGTDVLTFTCNKTPTINLQANVIIFD